MPSDITRRPDARSPDRSSPSQIDSFLADAESLRPAGQGRLIFALDATMSRQATWDEACGIQGEMFGAVGSAGSLAVQLVYYRGFSECRASKWVLRPEALRDLMTRINCRGGRTQIGKVLAHARRETGRQMVDAMVFIGDAMEEDIDALCHAAGQLGVLGLPCFMFQEGSDGRTERAFREIARLSGGAYMRFDRSAADMLRNLLRAVAAFASSGRAALEGQKTAESRFLLAQVKEKGGRPQE